MGWRGEEGRAGQSQHLWVRRTTPGLPCLLRCITSAPHPSRSLLCPFRSGFTPWGICLLGWSTDSAEGSSGKDSCS